MGVGYCNHCSKELTYFSGAAEVLLDPNSTTRLSTGRRLLCKDCCIEMHDFITKSQSKWIEYNVQVDEIVTNGDTLA